MPVIDQKITEQYALYCADTMEVLPEIPGETVGLSVYSPPFPELYQYSDDVRDVTNCTSYGESLEQLAFVVREVHRVTIPGRLSCVHCTDLKRGQLYQHDFPGDLIRIHEAVGMRFFCRVTINKDAWEFARRTRMISLMHKTLCEDSAGSRIAPGDYLLMFLKPGKNPRPVVHERGFREYAGGAAIPAELREYLGFKGDNRENALSHWIYRQYASPVWNDIRRGRFLPYQEARENPEEKHVCLARGSLVLTRDGHKPIEDVAVGDLVLTHRGRWRPVTAKVCNGTRPVVRITAQGVADLRVTPDHPLWARSCAGRGGKGWEPGSMEASRHHRNAETATPEWMRAEDTEGSYVNLPLPPIEESPLPASDWWLIGRWLGDGHFDTRGRAHISCAHEEAEELIGLMGDRAGHAVVRRTATQIAVKDRKGQRSTEFTAILKRCGRGAAGKKLPVEALSLDYARANAILSGYLSADGHYVRRYDRWSASSVSRPLLLGMAMVAQRARGVVASVYAGRPAGTCSIEGRTVRTRQHWVLSVPPRNLSGMLMDDGAWKKVRSVEDSGESEVWDIQVEEDESFVAEGCVVHNCPLQLDVIDRCIAMWSLPGDVVLTPFMGVGSEVHEAVRMGRKGIGMELKPSYYRQAVTNVQAAIEGLLETEVPMFSDQAIDDASHEVLSF